MKETGLIFSADMALANIEGRKSMTRRTQGLEFINGDPDAFEFIRMENDTAVFRQTHLTDITMLSKFPPLRSFPKSVDYAQKIFYIKCPFGQVGDKIWQREGFGVDYVFGSQYNEMLYIDYKAGGREDRRVSPEMHKDVLSHYGGDGWHPAIHMFRWMSRFEAPITELRAERLQEITQSPYDEDCRREGFANPSDQCLNDFMRYWDSLNVKRDCGWDLNKWIWVIGYKNGK